MIIDTLLILMLIFAVMFSVVLFMILLPAIGIFLLAILSTIAVAPFAALDWILRKIGGES
jgi:hypothetical protein